jgi:hypothetical protein
MAKKAKLPTDVNSRAKAIVDFATSDEDVAEKDEARAEGGRTGPVSCGGIAEGYVQFNGGFVTREPTCATLVVR